MQNIKNNECNFEVSKCRWRHVATGHQVVKDYQVVKKDEKVKRINEAYKVFLEVCSPP